jgi:hypothetical protein
LIHWLFATMPPLPEGGASLPRQDFLRLWFYTFLGVLKGR